MVQRDVELTSSPPPVRRRWGLLGVYVVVLAVVLAGGWAVAVRGDPTAEPPDTTVAPSSTAPRSPEELFEAVPASPIDGKQSQRLPVLATTQSDLVDGQVVTVLGKGFLPRERVGAVMCAAEAALEGVTACDLGSNGTFDRVAYANASPEGFVRVDVAVRPLIETPQLGPVDCLSAPERCIIAVGAVGDYDRSGGTAIGFAGQPAFAEPSLIVSGTAPYEPGAVIDLVGAGLLWPREVRAQICRDDRCATLATGRVGADGTFVASFPMPASFSFADDTLVTCDDGCELRLEYVALDGTSQAPTPAPLPVSVVVGEPVPGITVLETTESTVATASTVPTTTMVIVGTPYVIDSTLPPVSTLPGG